MANLALIIDHKACYGCLACEIACKQENNSDHGVRLIAVHEDGPRMMNGKLDFLFNVNACLHAACDGVPCIPSCEYDAIYQRDDGIVIMDTEACVCCEVCLPECPTGAIALNDNTLVTEKCNLCHHRVEKGLMPACADNICLAHCIYFGEVDEITAQMARKQPEPARV